MRDNNFISKTSDLTDDEASRLNLEIAKIEQESGWLATHFKSPEGKHCYNVNPKRQTDWDHFWGQWKSKFYRKRRQVATRDIPLAKRRDHRVPRPVIVNM